MRNINSTTGLGDAQVDADSTSIPAVSREQRGNGMLAVAHYNRTLIMKHYNIHGIKTLSNNFSLGIELSDSNDAARIIPTYEKKIAKPRWQEIKYNMEGSPYIEWYGTRHFLNEFIRL